MDHLFSVQLKKPISHALHKSNQDVWVFVGMRKLQWSTWEQRTHKQLKIDCKTPNYKLSKINTSTDKNLIYEYNTNHISVSL